MSDNMKYVISEDSDYLEHYGKGEAAKKALYTARNWVNGKWRYVYNTVNNALGADERRARDYNKSASETYAGVKQITDNKLKNAEDKYYKTRQAADNIAARLGGKTKGTEAITKNAYDEWTKAGLNARRSNALKNKYDKAYSDAQAAYDKTVYGKIEKGKNFINNIINKLKKKHSDSKYNRDVKKYAKSQGRSKRSGFQNEREYQEFMRNRK